MFAFSRQVPIATVDGAEGMRLGFNFTYTDHSGTSRKASQVLVVEFDAGGHTSTWKTNPPACSAGTLQGTECFNDPNGDPAQFIHFTPGYVQVLAQTKARTARTTPGRRRATSRSG